MAPARHDVAALALVAFAIGASLPGLLAAAPGDAPASMASWVPGERQCAEDGPLRLCTPRASYAAGARVDAILENRGPDPVGGRLRASALDPHGGVVERLVEADLILAAGVRLHLDWDARGPAGEPLPAGRYELGAWFAGRYLQRPVALG